MSPMSIEHFDTAEKYLCFNTSESGPSNLSAVRNAAALSIIEMQKCFEWIKSETNLTALSLEFRLDDTNYLFAQCQSFGRVPNRLCKIFIGLGCVPIFVGISNRLLHLRKAGALQLLIEIGATTPKDEFVEQWDPKANPVGWLKYEYGLTPNTSTSTADAMSLIFFHEAAHATRGHVWIRRHSSVAPGDHRRALESDADWCAGYLFMKYELQKLSQESKNNEEVVSAVITRLVLASATLHFALQLHSEESSSYHFPYTRMHDNAYGASAAWRAAGLPGDFFKIANDSYGHMGLIDEIVSDKIEQWIRRDDSRNILDEKSKRAITDPIIDGFRFQALSLEQGPIKGARRVVYRINASRQHT